MPMNLKNKVVLITGASSGIGKASAEQFAALGANLVLTGRRLDRIQALADKLASEHGVKAHALKMDVQKASEVSAAIERLPAEFSQIDVLLNNAGLALSTDLVHNASLDNWDTMIDTNLKGLLYVTRAILPGMVERDSGHVINISSIAGHDTYIAGNVYSATKHAVRALSKSLRLDLIGKQIRVSDVAPGAVNTEFSEVRWNDKAKADAFYADFDELQAEDIADAVVYCATRPAHVDIAEMVVMPTAQASVSNISRSSGVVGGIVD